MSYKRKLALISFVFLVTGCDAPGIKLAQIDKLDLGPKLNARVSVSLTGDNISATAAWEVRCHTEGYGYKWRTVPYPYLREALMSGSQCVFEKVVFVNDRVDSSAKLDYLLSVSINRAKANVWSLPSEAFGGCYRNEVYYADVYCKAKLSRTNGSIIAESPEFHSTGGGNYMEPGSVGLGGYEATANAARNSALEILKWAHMQIAH